MVMGSGLRTHGGNELSAETLERLKTNFRGRLMSRGIDGYESARMVFNAMIDKRPAAIAYCTGAADVIACVNFAREHEVPVAVRGGGHSVAGNSTCDAGLLIDLSAMKLLRVDPTECMAYAQPGLLLGEFDRATQTFGLATTLGVGSVTGRAGLTLGGGIR